MDNHAATAQDQLKLADDLAVSREQMWLNAQTAAQVHALLALAEAVRLASVNPLDAMFNRR